MSTYATQKDVENYIEGWVTDDSFALERLIQRAESDLDRLIIPSLRNNPPTQVISIPGAQSGTFDLHWNGTTSQAITEAFNVSGSKLQADLQALTDIGAGNVTVLGNNPYTLVWDFQWSTNYAATYIPLVSIDTANLLPAGIAANVTEVNGRKVNPLTDLNRNQVISLSRGTCAQVEYRNAMGESFFVRAQYPSVRGPDFQTQGRLPYVAPKAQRELSQTGLLFTQGRAVGSTRQRGRLTL